MDTVTMVCRKRRKTPHKWRWAIHITNTLCRLTSIKNIWGIYFFLSHFYFAHPPSVISNSSRKKYLKKDGYDTDWELKKKTIVTKTYDIIRYILQTTKKFSDFFTFHMCKNEHIIFSFKSIHFYLMRYGLILSLAFITSFG